MKHYGIDVSAERRSTLPVWDIEYESKFIYSELVDTLYYGSATGWVTVSGGGGGTSSHSALTELDYASANHTGFSPTVHSHTESNISDLDKYTQAEVDNLITTISGKLDDHNELNNLDYASAGHTGFQPAGDYATDAELTSTSGTLQTDIDTKATSGGAEHDNFSDFVANEHIDHNGVSVTAGTGLTGGGDITQTRTLDVDVGITNDKIVQIDDLDAASGDYAKLTTSGIEGRSYAETKTDMGYMTDLIDDTTPQLGGDLECNDQNILDTVIKGAAAKTSDFAGTVSAAARAVTFSSTDDYALCKIGGKVKASGDERIIVALPGSPVVTVDKDTTWGAATAIQEIQDPIMQHKDSAGNVNMYVNSFGGVGLLNVPDSLQKGIVFSDGDSGICETSDDSIAVFIGGTQQWKLFSNRIQGLKTDSLELLNLTASNIVPNINPTRGDTNTGLGHAAADQLSLIAGSKEAQRLAEINSKIYNIFNGTQTDSITDASTAAAAATLIKAGENFLTTAAVDALALIYDGTTLADYGAYRIISVDSDTQITVDRNFSATNTDVDFFIIKDAVLISPTDGTNGQMITNYSNQNKPLQLGGSGLVATTGLTGKDVVIGDNLRVEGNITTAGIIENITSHSATEAVTTATMYGNLHKITGAYTLTLPVAVIGMSGTFRASTAAVFSLKAGASDHFEMFDGTVLNAADKQTSGGTKNEFIQVYCEVANTWITIGQNGAMTDGGA